MMSLIQPKVIVGYFQKGPVALISQRFFARTTLTDRMRRIFAFKVDSLPLKVNSVSAYKVIKYPDPRLRAENQLVTCFDESLQELTSSMLSIMYEEDGIGLAAPQIGINKRVMVFNEEGSPSRKEKEMVLINPQIISRSDKLEMSEEGCLSFPSIRGIVQRHSSIEIEYQNLKGEKVHTQLNGFPAIIFQHEYDHLDKILFIDRFNAQDKANNARKLDKLIRKFGPGGAL